MSDAIDLSQVTWLHENISGWAQTSRLTAVKFEGNRICLEHTKAGLWPRMKGPEGDKLLEGNPWVFAKVNGRWHGATYEWLTPGQTCKHITASGEKSIGGHIKKAPLKTWVPQVGEVVGFCVSTFARGSSPRSVPERTQVVLAKWGVGMVDAGGEESELDPEEPGGPVDPGSPVAPLGPASFITTFQSVNTGKTWCADRNVIDEGARGCPKLLANRDNFQAPGAWEEAELEHVGGGDWAVRYRIADADPEKGRPATTALLSADGDGRDWRLLPNRPDIQRGTRPGDSELFRFEPLPGEGPDVYAMFCKGNGRYANVNPQDLLAEVVARGEGHGDWERVRSRLPIGAGSDVVLPPGGLPDISHWSRQQKLTSISGDFLTVDIPSAPNHERWSTLLLPSVPHLLGEVVAAHQARRYKLINLYVNNSGQDFGSVPRFDMYDALAEFKELCSQINQAGFGVTAWLAPDDNGKHGVGGWHRDSAARLPGLWDTYLPAIAPHCAGFVVGLECEEYWPWDIIVQLVRACHDRAAGTPVFVHFKTGTWGRPGSESSFWDAIRDHCDGLYYQYTPQERASNSAFAARTRTLVSRMHDKGKRFIASEHDFRGDGSNEANARNHGRIAMDNGADGFANGGPA